MNKMTYYSYQNKSFMKMIVLAGKEKNVINQKKSPFLIYSQWTFEKKKKIMNSFLETKEIE